MNPGDAAGRLLMVGAGNMGGAMLRRWLAQGVPAEAVTVVSPSGRAMPDGVRVVAAIPTDAFDTIVLAMQRVPRDRLSELLHADGRAVRLVGDARSPRTTLAVIHEAEALARAL